MLFVIAIRKLLVLPILESRCVGGSRREGGGGGQWNIVNGIFILDLHTCRETDATIGLHMGKKTKCDMATLKAVQNPT